MRALVFLLLLAAGVFAWPLMASVFDDADVEKDVLPVAVLGAAVLALGGILIAWFAISGLGGA